jgi:hypothetical protein
MHHFDDTLNKTIVVIRNVSEIRVTQKTLENLVVFVLYEIKANRKQKNFSIVAPFL